MVLESLVFFAAGLVLLIKGADFFVDASSRIAKILGVSDLVIGLTIVAVGTSLPEIASSLAAAYSGEPDLAIGNVVGSNIANFALVLGVAALVFGYVKVEKKVLDKDVLIMLMVSILFYYFSLNSELSTFEGMVFLVLFILYTMFLLGFMRRFEKALNYGRFLKILLGTEKYSVFNLRMYWQIMKAGIDPATYRKLLGFDGAEFEEKLGRRIDSGEVAEAKKIYRKDFLSSLFNQLVFLVIGGIGVIFGAQILVDASISLAETLGVVKSTIGLLLVAVGTSLPELSVSFSALRKGYSEILIGNLVGSNIANILLVLGLTSVFADFYFSFGLFRVPMFFMLVVAGLTALIVTRNIRVNRLIGGLLLSIYGVFVYFLYTTAVLP